MNVPIGVWIFSGLIVILLTWMTLWVTKKAYSKKWDDSDQDIET
ncbi:hypothetical protein SAMN04487969_106179 [Paenibacillus algorifonticola]|uniref:Uncharacterized protein n=1 Tax=Paenibacillus algorifonticola TaxID=684063 RepID=A0A1I2D867_9BACL|nr:hypothetical protein [Paenibacillus algorifonticola]SFE76747.1 hypothetical protein SAMN04487969_106179 [Paenibacillus algorifonticola]